MPKRELVTPRTQSKRAASKEALKQMQILLDDDEDDDQPEILSDDDVIPVDVTPPPRKKYKLSHRKSSDGNERDVIVLKSITNHNVANTLELDCWVEDLMPAQLAYKNQLELEHQELQAKLDALMSSSNAELIYKNELTSVTEISNCIENALAGTPSQPNIILNNAASGTGPASYQLVMDPRLGLIVGAVTNTTPTTSVAAPKPAAPQPQPQPPQPQKVFQTTSKFQYTGAKATAVRTQRGRGRAATVTNSNPPPKPGIQLKQPAPKPVRGRPAIATQSYSSNVGAADKSRELPLKQNVGVVRTVTKKVISTLSNDDNNARYMPDTKEIAFNKLQGKTYPSLVVVARPQLRTTDVSADRAKLDNKVKGVLMHPPTKFTEWEQQIRNSTSLPILDDPETFFNCTRMNLQTFELLFNKVGSEVETQTRQSSLPPAVHLLITLNYLAEGITINELAKKYNTTPTTIEGIVADTAIVLCDVLVSEELPELTVEKWEGVALDFLKRWNMPNCLGAIDGKILNKSGKSKSLQILAIFACCDAYYRFTMVDVTVVNSPSRNARARAANKSDIKYVLINAKSSLPTRKILPKSNVKFNHFFVTPGRLFADSKHVIQPYHNALLTDAQTYFNVRLNRVHWIIENAFKLVTERWYILSKNLSKPLKYRKKIVETVVVLHNFVMNSELKIRPQARMYYTDFLCDYVDNEGNLQPTGNYSNLKSLKCALKQNEVNAKNRDVLTKYFLGVGDASLDVELKES